MSNEYLSASQSLYTLEDHHIGRIQAFALCGVLEQCQNDLDLLTVWYCFRKNIVVSGFVVHGTDLRHSCRD